jgi:hypothetical protein
MVYWTQDRRGRRVVRRRIAVSPAPTFTEAMGHSFRVAAIVGTEPARAGRVSLHVGAEKLSIDMQSTTDIEFRQTDRFAVAPQGLLHSSR